MSAPETVIIPLELVILVHIQLPAQMRRTKTEVGMNTSKLRIEHLQWQLDFIGNQEPATLGSVIQGYDYSLSTEPENWAAEILEFFTYRCFEGFNNFLSKLEENYGKVNQSFGEVELQIFREWNKLQDNDEDELFFSAIRNGVNATFHPEDGSVHIDSFERKEWRKKLFDCFELFELAERHSGSRDTDARLSGIARRLTELGPYRRFDFDVQTIQRLEELCMSSPSFFEVTDRVIEAIGLAQSYSRPIRITPILLVGAPGIGKSYYAGQLAHCLGVPIKQIAVDNLQEGAGLAGSSRIYSNSAPGEIFNTLTEGDHLSPVVILDEIDKAGASLHGDTLSPLHSLLEPVSAKTFADASVGLPIDASSVIWIATANDLGRIPKTLLSRFEVFGIPDQGQETKAAILMELCENLQADYHDVEFAPDLLEALLDKTPREQRQLLERALARANRTKETTVTLNHLRQVAPVESNSKLRRKIGYA